MTPEKVSAIGILLAGLIMAAGAEGLCRKKRNAPQIRSLGVCLAIAGVALLILP